MKYYKALFHYLFVFLVLIYGKQSLATNVTIDGDVAYNISSGQITVNIDRVTNNSTSGHSGSLRIKLWASTSSYSGSGNCCNGYTIADFSLNNGEVLHAGYYYQDISRTLSFSSPPDGTYNVVMTLLEYTGSEYVIRDYRNFSKLLTVGAGGGSSLSIDGEVSFNISSGQITVNIDRVTNNSTSGHSGSLRIKLWASTSSYSGSGNCCNGYTIADFSLNNGEVLHAGYYYQDISRTLSFSSPPDGTYNVVMTLLEYTGSEYVIRDYRNFSQLLTVGTGGGNDDHGNDASNATLIYQTDIVAGNIDVGGDFDFFTFVPNLTGKITVYSSGTTDLLGYLWDDTSNLIAFDDDSGEDYNFRIEEIDVSVDQRYYISISGLNASTTGSYQLHTEFSATQQPQCNDGVDNDGDGLIDSNDPGCSSATDDDEYNVPAQCNDGVDNDGDGLIDSNDPGCSSTADDDEYNAPPTTTTQSGSSGGSFGLLLIISLIFSTLCRTSHRAHS